ncbi:ERMES complex subunit [Coemansia sp. RSA 2618]|nr:ERMES complex subunit [Coemansia sp. RSA 2618]
MSFKFQWTGFPAEFNTEALEMLTQALNKGENKPPNLVGPIVAKELDLGSAPPELDILEISELEPDRFRALFRMKYEGDGFLVLQTQVQANPLRLPSTLVPTMPSMGVVAAAAPLVVPMLLRISGLRLNGIVVLAVSKDDGVTLVFRSDPLVAVEVHSTFDAVPSVRRMLQREIEATLRTLFQEDLPVIVHEMSVREIRRAREARDRVRREHIARQQRLIRQRHADSAGAWRARTDSGAASAASLPASEQRLLASQLHHRLMELSKEDARIYDSQSVYGAKSLRQWTQSLGGMDAPGLAAQDAQSLGALDAQSLEALDAPGLGAPGFATPPHLSMARGGSPESLERYLNDDWERMQQSAELDAYLRRQDAEQRELEQRQNGVVLRPADSAVAARLASLMNMGQTLSPYTRRFAHTTMRSDVVPPRFGVPAHRHAGHSANADNPSGSPPLSPGGSMASHALLQASFSAGASAATPFSAISPPSGGVRSPFSRNRTLRRKVHRINSISRAKGAAEQ